MERARGDGEAFAELYRRHYPAIQRYLRRRLGDPELVEDVVAETFMGALRSLGRYRDRGLPFRSWLYRIATVQASQARRRAARIAMARLEEEPGRSDPEESPSAEVVRAALLQLPARHQAVIALHYFEGLDVAQVAQTLGVRPGTVKSRLSRGREVLRRRLERLGVKE